MDDAEFDDLYRQAWGGLGTGTWRAGNHDGAAAHPDEAAAAAALAEIRAGWTCVVQDEDVRPHLLVKTDTATEFDVTVMRRWDDALMAADPEEVCGWDAVTAQRVGTVVLVERFYQLGPDCGFGGPFDDTEEEPWSDRPQPFRDAVLDHLG